jgi:hypothetical protein
MAENNQNTKIITYALGIGAGYFFILKPILIKLGFMQSEEQVQQDLSQTQNIQDYLGQSITNQTPTKSRGEWQIIANNIYNDLYHAGVSDNKSDAGYQITRVQNDADFSVLYDTFGKRQEYYFGVPTGGLQDLVQFIIGNLNRTEINKINDNYSRKGIKFRF